MIVNLRQALEEKYYHSRASVFLDEGRLVQAIRFFRKSLRICDQPAIRMHLALAYMAKDDLEKAAKEMNRAIELAPNAAEYYHLRSGLWRLGGQAFRAGQDEKAAIALDGNYRRIERIRKASDTLHDAFCRSSFRECTDVNDERLRSALFRADAVFRGTGQGIEEESCIVPCPAYCCHFIHEPVVHGLTIGAWKLQAIRHHLKEKGLPENDFIGKFPVKKSIHIRSLIPPHMIMKEGGQEVVFYPKRKTARLCPSLMNDLPKSQDYRSVVWITKKARPCAFLEGGRCIVHDIGGESSLPSCKEFLCLTGLVFLVLSHLGITGEAQIRKKRLGLLNRVAVEALLLLSDRIYGEESHLSKLRVEMGRTLSLAIDADVHGGTDIEGMMNRYLQQEREYVSALAREKDDIFDDIGNMLDQDQGKPIWK